MGFEFKMKKTFLYIKEARMGIETFFDEKVKFSEAHKKQVITFLETVIVHLKGQKEE